MCADDDKNGRTDKDRPDSPQRPAGSPHDEPPPGERRHVLRCPHCGSVLDRRELDARPLRTCPICNLPVGDTDTA